MSLIHYVRPFLELGFCKEYCMARKTTGTTTADRRKKTEVPVPPAAVQVAPQVQKEVQKPVHEEVRKDVRKNGAPAKPVPVNLAAENIEDEIRRRAYELYIQRRATSDGENGDESQDWLLAEREIRSRQSSQKQLGAAAGGVRA
jgi:hypothetical protein